MSRSVNRICRLSNHRIEPDRSLPAGHETCDLRATDNDNLDGPPNCTAFCVPACASGADTQEIPERWLCADASTDQQRSVLRRVPIIELQLAVEKALGTCMECGPTSR